MASNELFVDDRRNASRRFLGSTGSLSGDSGQDSGVTRFLLWAMLTGREAHVISGYFVDD